MLANSLSNSREINLMSTIDVSEKYELMYLQNRLKHLLPTMRFVTTVSMNGDLLQAETKGKFRIYLAPLSFKSEVRIPVVSLPEVSNQIDLKNRPKANVEVIVEDLNKKNAATSRSVKHSTAISLRRKLVLVDIEEVVSNTLEMIDYLKEERRTDSPYFESAA